MAIVRRSTTRSSLIRQFLRDDVPRLWLPTLLHQNGIHRWATTALAISPCLWLRCMNRSRPHSRNFHGTLLYDGDLILIEKAIAGYSLNRWCVSFREKRCRLVHGVRSGEERAKLLRSEVHGLLQYAPLQIHERPPAALTGHVVVGTSPASSLSDQLAVKRVVVSRGQYSAVRVVLVDMDMDMDIRQHPARIISVPDYSPLRGRDNKNIGGQSKPIALERSANLVGISGIRIVAPSRCNG
jgi:hypothetical protein